MHQATAKPNRVFCDRELFLHDGGSLRRLRLSAPVQLLLAAVMLALLGWSTFATARLVASPSASVAALDVDLPALVVATAHRARQIEYRQQLLAAMLAGEEVDATALGHGNAAAALPGEIGSTLTRLEDAQQLQADAATRTIDTRYRNAAAALRRLGINPARFTSPARYINDAMGGPFEPASSGDPTFKALFTSWKKLDQLQDGAIAVPSEKPVRAAAFTSGYGVRSDPFQGRAAMHPGIDLAGPVGTPIYATADGIVLRSGWNSGGYGNLIELDHGRGIATRYGHLSAVLVEAGRRVKRGELIARMGSTGRSTGCHLHYEVRIDGRAVNPIPFMKSTDYLVAIQLRGQNAPLDSLALGGPPR